MFAIGKNKADAIIKGAPFMHTIATLNHISETGLERFSDDYVFTNDLNSAEGILVRSYDMLDMTFSKDLLAIARAGAGVNNIPITRCAEEGIVVFNTPGANANAVKEMALAAIFLAARNLPGALEWTKTLTSNVAQEVEKGKSKFTGNEIKGKTLGVIGLGYIGVLVANAAENLGMNVVGYDPSIHVKAAHELSRKIPLLDTLDDMLPQCDYVTIHVPAITSTNGMIDQKRLSQMKMGVCLLNFSRENLVNEEALFDAIDSGIVKKYITDFPTDNLVGKRGVVCLPHLGASTAESEEHCAVMAVDQMMNYLESGNITHSVNYPTISLGPFDRSSAEYRVCILNKNIPSMLQKITSALADVNISDMVNKSKGDFACTLIDIDSCIDSEELKNKLSFEGIVSVRIIKHPEKDDVGNDYVPALQPYAYFPGR